MKNKQHDNNSSSNGANNCNIITFKFRFFGFDSYSQIL